VNDTFDRAIAMAVGSAAGSQSVPLGIIGNFNFGCDLNGMQTSVL